MDYQARDSHKHGDMIDVYSVCTSFEPLEETGQRHEKYGQQLPKSLLLSPSSEPVSTKKVTLLPVSSTSLLCICPLLSLLCCFMLFSASGLLSPLMSLLTLLQWPACRMRGHQHLDARPPARFLLMVCDHLVWFRSSSLHMDLCPCFFSIWAILPANIKESPMFISLYFQTVNISKSFYL